MDIYSDQKNSSEFSYLRVAAGWSYPFCQNWSLFSTAIRGSLRIRGLIVTIKALSIFKHRLCSVHYQASREVEMRFSKLQIGVLILALFGITSLMWSQAETGQIIGTVTDPSGAIVAGASVSVRSVATGAERVTTTNPAGEFTVPNLLPENYEVTVTAAGFETVKQTATVTVGMKLGLDFKLPVGRAQTVVEVQAAGAVTVNTETQTISQVLSTQQMLELPTITRDPYSLVVTSGNVSEDDPSGRGAGVSINGLRSAGTNILLDGVANNNEFMASVGQMVPLDSVQEIGIITNNFTAEYGRADAGVINVTTKSGTNDLHGTAYEFNRVSDLASNTFNNNANGLHKPIFVRNQFGYSVGGPIKRDKLFFYSSTEWTRVRSAANITTVVPDPALIAAAAPATQSIFATYGKLSPNASVLRTFSRNQLAASGNDPCSAASPTGGCVAYNPDAPMFDLIGYNVPSNSGAGIPQNTYSNVERVDASLCQAIRATFQRRKTALPTAPPLALTAEFGTDAAKVRQWEAFLKKGKLDAGGSTLEQVCAFLNGFLMPPTLALAAGHEFQKAWPPAGPWRDEEGKKAVGS